MWYIFVILLKILDKNISFINCFVIKHIKVYVYNKKNNYQFYFNFSLFYQKHIIGFLSNHNKYSQ